MTPTDGTDQPKPVVESSPQVPDLTTRALQERIRQQEILAELGVVALQSTPFLGLLNETVRLTAEGMNAEFCKVLEYIPKDNRLLVRAGVGWHEGIVGKATIGADLESPSGFALHTGKPVISNHLENEQRFRTPELLVEHGIRRAMNVILQGDGAPYGVLEVDSRSEGEFSQNDIAFLQGAANILGMAIERQRYERQLKDALDRHQILLKEITHRVKNLFAVVDAMISLSVRSARTPQEFAQALRGRLAALLRAKELIRPGIMGTEHAASERTSVGALVRTILEPYDDDAFRARISVSGPEVVVGATAVTSLALALHESATNAVKYGALSDPNGAIRIEWDTQGDDLRLKWEETGGPAIVVTPNADGFGSVLTERSIVSQLGGTIEYDWQRNGLKLTLTVPLDRLSV